MDRLDQVIGWERFRPTLEKTLEGSASIRSGDDVQDLGSAKVLPSVGRADGYQIKDRLSFQKFLGLTLADAVADKNTIGDFKQRLIEAGVMEKLFERFKGHLKDQGLIAQEGKTAQEWEDQAAKLRPKDTDARWAKKGGEVHFGYMTNSMGGIFLTCIGMRKTAAAIGLMNLIYHMARYEQLMRLANSS